MMVTQNGLVVHFRAGAPGVRLHGSKGDLAYDFVTAWQRWVVMEVAGRSYRVEVPWPGAPVRTALWRDLFVK